MNRRLQQFLSAENITQAQFADSINVARAGVSHILAGRNKPGWDFIINTINRYPDLNIEWLLTGKGRMYKTPAERNDVGNVFDLIEDSPTAGPAPRRTAEPEPRRVAAREPRGGLPGHYADLAERENVGPQAGENAVNEPSGEYNPEPQVDFSPSAADSQRETKRRTATKVMVFFDDGTFQEF